MAKTHPPKASEPLNHRAVNLVAEKHYIKDAFVAFAERERSTRRARPSTAFAWRRTRRPTDRTTLSC